MNRYTREDFGNYITEMRKKYGLSMERLSEGLVELSILGKFEKGDRFPDKLTRDRLLSRMGETADSYENYLCYDEFFPWKLRQQILQAIVDLDREKSENLISRYENTYDMTNPVEKQFVLAMKGMILKRDGASREELAELYHRAVSLTVSDITEENFEKKSLSMQELYLILEYVNYSKPTEEKVCWFEKVLTYIKNSPLDDVCRAKIYPQTVYFLYRELEKKEESLKETEVQMLGLSNQAIEMLRDAHGSYYLWELLQVRKGLLQKMEKTLNAEGEAQKSSALELVKKENEEWIWAVEEVRKELGRPFEMQDECYLYVEKEAYCIGDVIRIRREMLGLSRQQLCEGICSLKTIGRIENNKLRTQRPIVRELFQRLNLPMEFQRTELVSSSMEAQRLMDDLRCSINERENEKVEKTLKKLREMVSLEIPMNRQTLMRIEVLNQKQTEQISKEEFLEKIREVLEYTMPYEAAVSEKSGYMTEEEVGCIHNMVSNMNWDNPELQKCLTTLRRCYTGLREEGFIGAYINSYELVMSGVASQLGNKGEYDTASDISKTILSECLKWNRITFIPGSLYDLTWNYEQKEKEHIPVEEKRNVFRDINLCVIYSRFGRRKFMERSYKRKLEQRKSTMITL
ncbi:MAG: helix-turn-helix transcriptional regulator [Lachnospiraceae bacterium]|nr:helix-turn-helix transcriptional regulator [Lachnospiraceae bacterium]